MDTRWRLAAAAVFISACAVGPKYTRPSAPVPPAYQEPAPDVVDAWKRAQPGDTVARGSWWERFHDARLNELEEHLNRSNQTVAAAAAGVQIARAVVREARSQYFPAVTANPAINYARVTAGFGVPLGNVYTSYLLPFEASWEPDLWGRVRKTVSSSTLTAQASVADFENVRLAAQAELAADYYELRAQDALKDVLDAAVAAYQETVEITSARYIAGLESDEAVAQAEAQLRATQAQDLNLGVLRAQYEHAIATLMGEPASTFSLPAQRVEFTPPATPPGLPSELLERRPDIAAAERAVAAANEQIGIASAAFFPTVLLNATGGFQGLSLAQWLTWPSRIWSVGPSLAQTIFDAGLRRATVQQVRASYDQTVANYRQTVLTAFQQVEDNLAALRVLTQVIEQQDAAVDAAKRALDEADARYRGGVDPYLNVITAQTTLLNSQLTAVSFRMQQMVASVQLIKALGGGWDVSQMPAASALSTSTR